MADHPTKHPHQGGHDHKPGHEGSDVHIWAIGKFGIGLAIVTILSIGLMIGLFKYFQAREPEPVALDPVKMFPLPQLEQREPTDLKGFREEEDKEIAGYAWEDKQKGVVRIPIAQAMDLLVARGVPTRASAPAPTSTVSMPTESGLGEVAKK